MNALHVGGAELKQALQHGQHRGGARELAALKSADENPLKIFDVDALAPYLSPQLVDLLLGGFLGLIPAPPVALSVVMMPFAVLS